MEMICFLLAIKQWPSDVSFREDFVRYFLLLAYIAILLYGLQFIHSTLNKWTDASISVNEGDLVETFVENPDDPQDPGEWKPPEWKSQSVIYDPDFPQGNENAQDLGPNFPQENENENENDIQDLGPDFSGNTDNTGNIGNMMGGDSWEDEPLEPSIGSMFPLWFLVRPIVNFFQIKGETLLSQKTYVQLLMVMIVVYGTTFLFVYILSQAGQYGHISLWLWLGLAAVLYGVYALMRFILKALNKSESTDQRIPHRQNLSILAVCIVIIHGIGKHISRIAHAQLLDMENYMRDNYKWGNIEDEIASVKTLRERYTSSLLGKEMFPLDQWTWIDWYRIAEVYLFKFGRIQPGILEDPNPLISWIPSFLVSNKLKPGQTATRILVMKQRKKLIWSGILLAMLLNLLFSKMSFPEFFITNKMLFATGGILTMLNKYRFPASSQ